MPSLKSRKQDHITICLNERVSGFTPTGFEKIRFIHNALPEIDFGKIDTGLVFLGKRLNLPFFVSSMTDGYGNGKRIACNLAQAAQVKGMAFSVGSQRVALANPKVVGAFQVRDIAPDILLLANLGAVQLNYGYQISDYRRAVEMIQADGLFLHLNPVQEAIQPEGDTNFANLLPKIEKLVKEIGVPVIVKEVGMGISGSVARQLRNIGVEYLDVAGQGGTSWARVEGCRGDGKLGEAFSDWGVPTLDALRQCSKIKGLAVLASGGVRNGIEVAKALALGAKLVGLALPFLEPAAKSAEAVMAKIETIEKELRIAMFGVGAQTLAGLNSSVIE